MQKHFARSLAMLALAAGAAQASPVPGVGTWETTLLGRDLNGHAVSSTSAEAVFAYDTVLDATWYLTGNNTGLNWNDARSWAAGLTVGAFSGWSLPSADEACEGYFCTNSQMGELYWTALGSTQFQPPENTGPFKNLQPHVYWSGTEYAPSPGDAWYFDTYYFHQYPVVKTNLLYALAIRPGDVYVVPEPSIWAMLSIGLLGLGAAARRRKG